MLTLFLVILGLVGAILFYEFVIVPFHRSMARKIGCGYDRSTNRFTHDENCLPKCWHKKYEVKP